LLKIASFHVFKIKVNDRNMFDKNDFLLLQKDEVYLNLVLEYVPETVYRVARNYSKNKQTLPPLLIKVVNTVIL